MIIGTDRDELRRYVASALAAGQPFDGATYRHLLDDTFGTDAERIAARPSRDT